jgi:hypothetical protein
LLETGKTKLQTNKNINKIGNAGVGPVSEPNNAIQMINNIRGTANKT